jgi:CheY-like chemotaxis protein/HPt (histidine-containing phosphotransfer) domain-containing protein
VVDDNQTTREILEEMLRAWGAKPSAFGDGSAALEALHQALLEHRPFSFALIDSMMPGMSGVELADRITADGRFDSVSIALLKSTGRTTETSQAEEPSRFPILNKPVRQSVLYQLISERLYDQSRGVDRLQDSPVDTDLSITSKGRSLRVLLAEDNLVNQKVAVAMLEGMGHRVIVVPDGRKAVDAWLAEPFDLILMDVQMPEMDGLEAVAAIRAAEQIRDSRTLIIALTAHAMMGDRDRCLSSGFDDYLSKPIRSHDFRQTLQKWSEIRKLGSMPASDAPTASPESGIEFDHEKALDRVGGDETLLAEVIGIFLEDCPRLLGEIDKAVMTGDRASLGRLAHTLRGVASNFALSQVEEASSRLERMAKSAGLDDGRSAIQNLKQAMDRVRPSLEAVISSRLRAS